MAAAENHVMWNMTRNCNFSCHYCYFPHLGARVEQTLDVDALVALLDSTGREWTVGMTGGEPLIYPDFPEICRKLTENHRIGLDSNLSLPKVVREFAETVDPARVDDIYAALHIEERERRGNVEAFIANVLLLKERGFHITVNYVIHPTIIDRFERDCEYFASRGVEITPRPFKGRHEGVVYPAGYRGRARDIFRSRPRSARKMVYNFKGVPCRAGYSMLRLEPDGTVMRCSADRKVLGRVGGEVRLNEGAEPCVVGRCPCFGIDYVELEETQRRFVEGLQQYVLGSTGAADAAFAEVLKADAEMSPALNNRGVLLWDEGKREEAAEYFAEAHALHPENRVFAENLASALSGLGREPEAAAVCSAYAEKTGIVLTPEPDLPRALCVDVVPAQTREDIFPSDKETA